MHAWGAFHCSAEPYGTLRRPLFPHDSRARVHWRPDEAAEAVFLCIDPAPAKPHGACQAMVHARLADEWPCRGFVRCGMVEGRVRSDERFLPKTREADGRVSGRKTSDGGATCGELR